MDRKLLQMYDEFNDVEKGIVNMTIERLFYGRDQYGPWKIKDGRNMIKEAIAEASDLNQYLLKRLIELGAGQ